MILLLLLASCKGEKANGTESAMLKGKGLLMYSPTMHSSYFFPFHKVPDTVDVNQFVEYEYDTGFVMLWPTMNSQDRLLTEFAIAPPIRGGAIRDVMFVELEYDPNVNQVQDTLLFFDIACYGITKTLVYRVEGRSAKEVIGIGYPKRD